MLVDNAGPCEFKDVSAAINALAVGQSIIFQYFLTLQIIYKYDHLLFLMSSSEHLRHSSPLSSSPGRPLHLSRPHWPWSTYSHRSSQSSVSAHSTGTASVAQVSWDPRSSSSASTAHSSTTMWLSSSSAHRQSLTTNHAGAMVPLPSDETTRQWSFTVCNASVFQAEVLVLSTS